MTSQHTPTEVLPGDAARLGATPHDGGVNFAVSSTIADEVTLCLFDADGPCANAVKDAQRTKTAADTRRTLSLIWGTTALPGRAARAEAWYRQLLEQHGAATQAAAGSSP